MTMHIVLNAVTKQENHDSDTNLAHTIIIQDFVARNAYHVEVDERRIALSRLHRSNLAWCL